MAIPFPSSYLPSTGGGRHVALAPPANEEEEEEASPPHGYLGASSVEYVLSPLLLSSTPELREETHPAIPGPNPNPAFLLR